ncbi:MAG: O-antigen ligase family protein [Candidatus Magasanikbacteria bacterium]|nr:O-antigen ligase family protein [Candidatus Magasanikbacteria bacterium]
MQFLRKLTGIFAYLILIAPMIVWNGVYFTFNIPRWAWLIATVSIFFVLSISAYNEAWQLRLRKIDIFFSAFVALLCLSLFWSSDVHASLWSGAARNTGVSLYVLWFIWFFSLRIIRWTEMQWRNMFAFSIVVAATVSAWSIAQVYIFGQTGDDRVSGTAGNALILAMYLAPHVFLCALLISERVRWALSKLYIGGIVVCGLIIGAGVALSFSRSSYLGIILGFVVGVVGFVISTRASSGSKRVTKILIGALCAIVFAYGLLYSYSKITGSALSRVTINKDSFATLDTRIINWKIALKGIRAHPILGVGWENYRTVVDTMFDPSLARFSYYETRIDKPHNVFLEVWVTTGTVGLLIYLALIYFTISTAWKLYCTDKLSAAGAWSIIGFVTAYHSQNFFAFDTPQTLFILAPVLAFLSTLDEPVFIFSLASLQKMRRIIVVCFSIASIVIFVYAGWAPLRTMTYISEGLSASSEHDFNSVDAAFRNAFVGVQGPYYFETWRWFAQALLNNYANGTQKLSELTPDQRARWEADVLKITELTKQYAAANTHSVEWQTFTGKVAYYIAIDRNDDAMLTFSEQRFLTAYGISHYRQEPPILLSYIYGLKGDNVKAVQWYMTAVALTQSSETKDAFNFLLDLFVKTHDNDSIDKILNAAIIYQPDADTYARRAAAYADSGRYDDARAAVNRAVELDPTFASEAIQFLSTFPNKK